MHTSAQEKFFRTQLRFPMKFQLKLSRNSCRECVAQFCSDLPPHSHYQSIDFYPSFHSNLFKPISTWFLAFESAVVQSFSKLYQNVLKKTIFLPYTMQNSPNLNKPIPMNSIVSYRNSEAVQFLDKMKPIRNDPVKIFNKPTEVNYEF